MVRRNITADDMRTLFHEMVGHYGLRKLLGQRNYDTLCSMVYDKMSSKERDKWRKYAERELKGDDVYEAMTNEKRELAVRQTAADEYMASLAENGCKRPELSTWQRIKQFIRDVLRRMKINVNLSDYDIAMLLYESKMNIGNRDIIENSVVGEIHEDKNNDMNIMDVVRLYGCVDIDGKLNKTINGHKPIAKTDAIKMPSRVIELEYKNDSDTTLIMVLDEGWQISFRIHSASTLVENSLKFDIQLIGNPPILFTQHLF